MLANVPMDKERQIFFFFGTDLQELSGQKGFLEVQVPTVFYFTNLDILDI